MVSFPQTLCDSPPPPHYSAVLSPPSIIYSPSIVWSPRPFILWSPLILYSVVPCPPIHHAGSCPPFIMWFSLPPPSCSLIFPLHHVVSSNFSVPSNPPSCGLLTHPHLLYLFILISPLSPPFYSLFALLHPVISSLSPSLCDQLCPSMMWFSIIQSPLPLLSCDHLSRTKALKTIPVLLLVITVHFF